MDWMYLFYFLLAGLIFWGVTLVMLAVGCSLLQKFRRRFIDTL